MNTLTVPIGAEGAQVEVAVGLSHADAHARRQAGSPIPPPLTGRALLDTGAEISGVDPALLAPLFGMGIQPERFIFVNMPGSGASPLPVYAVSLTIPPVAGGRGTTLRNHPVVAQDLAQLGYQVVLGRDVLERCVLIYDGPGKKVTLAY